MVQKTFGIYSDDATASHLHIELGANHLICWTTTDEDALASFEFFNAFNDTTLYLKDIYRNTKLHSKILDGKYDRVDVVLNNECCLVLPKTDVKAEDQNALMYFAFGELMQTEKRIADGVSPLLYSVHEKLNDLLRTEFPGATIAHKYEYVTSQTNNIESSQLLLTCYLDHCILSATRGGQLQLIQRFSYETPEDVIYHVLNAADQLSLNLTETQVEVQGLIEKESDLYGELYKYIPNIDTVQNESLKFASDAFESYPSHYFTSFIKRTA